MIPLLAGVAALVLLWWLGRFYANADPKKLALMIRRGGGVAALAVAAVLLLRGRLDMAIALAGVGWWLLGGPGPSVFGFRLPGLGQGSRKTPGGRSSVRSATLEMELDHDAGAVRGRVLSGRLAGRQLDTLTPAELIDLHREIAGSDPDGRRLLEAYLDRRFPLWREHTEAHAHAGARRESPAGTMSEEEACQVLGLQPGASEDEIRRAHRSLMKKLHPDQGGSTYLASRVNQAKDVLLNRHR